MYFQVYVSFFSMLYTFRSGHIHHSYYLSFSYCLSTQWLSLSRNPLPRSEFRFPHGHPTTKKSCGQFRVYQVYLLSDTAFGFRLSQYTDTPTGYGLYTCFSNLYDLRASTIVFHHPSSTDYLYDAYKSSLIVSLARLSLVLGQILTH